MKKLEGQLAIITGGARGIGAGICKVFCEAGATVALWDVLDGQETVDELTKDGHNIHLFNMHTTSDSFGDNHDVRVEQFNLVKDFVDSKDIPSNELVLLGGDFNEDKDCRSNTCNGTEAKYRNQTYYNEMVEILSAHVPTYNGDSFTYDTEQNTLLKGLYSEEDCDYYQYTLDYIFYSMKHLIPSDESACEVVYPDGIDLSDHLPVSCTYSGIGVFTIPF